MLVLLNCSTGTYAVLQLLRVFVFHCIRHIISESFLQDSCTVGTIKVSIFDTYSKTLIHNRLLIHIGCHIDVKGAVKLL